MNNKIDVSLELLKLKELGEDSDTEQAHVEADIVLCKLLIKLGYEDVVKAWAKIKKWYA